MDLEASAAERWQLSFLMFALGWFNLPVSFCHAISRAWQTLSQNAELFGLLLHLFSFSFLFSVRLWNFVSVLVLSCFCRFCSLHSRFILGSSKCKNQRNKSTIYNKTKTHNQKIRRNAWIRNLQNTFFLVFKAHSFKCVRTHFIHCTFCHKYSDYNALIPVGDLRHAPLWRPCGKQLHPAGFEWRGQKSFHRASKDLCNRLSHFMRCHCKWTQYHSWTLLVGFTL